MLKGLAITPPVVGRISIGRIVEKNGKRLPEKDDQFTITTQVQTRDGWLRHPHDEVQRKLHGGDKLRTVSIRLPFNDPDLNLRANYSCFDREDGQLMCMGNGETCRRKTEDGVQMLPCPAPDRCDFHRGGCKPYGRLHVVVGDQDELGTFVLRTTSYNSIRTLAARMRYLHAVSGGNLATLPLELRLRGKSTTQSHRAAIYYIDLVVGNGLSLEAAIQEARGLAEERANSGFDQQALDNAARLGYANGAFEESEEDTPAVAEEFFPELLNKGPQATPRKNTDSRHSALSEKLRQRAETVST